MANQVVYKDGSNVATGSANLTFNGTTLTGVSAAFSGSNGTALVSITQAGAGNALIVEDVNPDSTPFVIDAAGNVTIGATAVTAGEKLDVIGRVGIRSTSLGDGVRLAGNGSNVNLGRYVTLTPASLSASRTLTLPDVTGTVITTGNLTSITNVGTLTGLTVTGGAINGTLTKTVTGTGTADLIYGNMADNDQFRIRIGGTATNAGYVEIATADDGTEPIYVRQYSGVFDAVLRSATLLDGSGNTIFPGTVNATTFSGSGASLTSIPNSATTATSSETAYAIVARDANASFTARTGIFKGGYLGGIDYTDAITAGAGATDSGLGVIRVGKYTTNVTGITINHAQGAAAGTAYHMSFYRNGANVGSISDNGSNTAFNTSSDYRLKENVKELEGALVKVNALQPKTYNFITTPEITQDGFLAHELLEVVPYAVSGEKDALDTEGNIRPQQVDYSKLTALLVGAVQELSARVRELENNQ